MPGSSSLGFVKNGSAYPDVLRHHLSIEARAGTGPVALASAPSDPAVQYVPRRPLLLWNFSLVLFHGLLAVLTLTLGRRDLSVTYYKTYMNVTTTPVVNEAGESITSWELLPYYTEAGTLALTSLVAAFFLLSAGFHLLNCTLLKDYYLRNLSLCYTPTRWIEYFFSASIMQLIIAYTLGIRERAVLLSVCVLVAITMPFGFWTEQVARPASPDTWTKPIGHRLFPWILGHIPQATAWFIVLVQMYDVPVGNNVPWFVYLILWGEFILFWSFGFVQLATQCMPPRRFYLGEIAFQILSLVSKGLLGVVLISFVLMLSRFEDIYDSLQE